MYDDVHFDYSKGTSESKATTTKPLFNLARYQSVGNRRGKINNSVDDVGKMFASATQLENSAKMYVTMISTSVLNKM